MFFLSTALPDASGAMKKNQKNNVRFIADNVKIATFVGVKPISESKPSLAA